ncbi:MAG: Ig-like domain-containing protein, partial [Phycisphaerales bacterium]|nr:Ig-like domain-containing protein [Phycisphaerales bacterium]
FFTYVVTDGVHVSEPVMATLVERNPDQRLLEWVDATGTDPTWNLAFDGDPLTFAQTSPYGSVSINLGTGNRMSLTSVLFTSVQNNEFRLENAEIQGTNDPHQGSSATAIYTLTSGDATNSQALIDAASDYSVFRIKATGMTIYLAEFELYGVPAVTQQVVLGDDLVRVAKNSLSAASIDVLANDRGVGGSGGLVISSVGTPSNGGTVTVNPDGYLEYTPAASFSGLETLAYTVQDGRGDYTTPGGMYGYMEKHGDSSGYTWYATDGSKVVFDSGGQLVERVDRYGNGVEVIYDSVNTDQIKYVRDIQDDAPVEGANARKLTFGYTGDRLTGVQDWTGRVWGYEYYTAADGPALDGLLKRAMAPDELDDALDIG